MRFGGACETGRWPQASCFSPLWALFLGRSSWQARGENGATRGTQKGAKPSHDPSHPIPSHLTHLSLSRSITSQHITTHHITSHHITSHHIKSHHITSHHITSSHHITTHPIAVALMQNTNPGPDSPGILTPTTLNTVSYLSRSGQWAVVSGK